MILSQLQLRGFRCLADQELVLHSRMNWLIGGNAAGKTSVLEAVYWLGRGKSFRTARAAQCIRRGDQGWRIAARLERADCPADRIAVRFTGRGLEPSCNDRAETVVAQARRVPVQLIEPGLHRVVEDGPGYRRRFLDWGMFHVEQDYLPVWRAYARALRQRNTALRERSDAASLAAWTRELVARGEALAALRERGMARLREKFRGRGVELGLPELEIALYRGWDEGAELTEVLAAREDRDRRLGATGSGPHRAELRFRMDGEQAREHISRGQQKLLLAALSLAQADVIVETTGAQPLLLLDDFTAELGSDFQAQLVAALAAYPGQSIISSLERPVALVETLPMSMFHVEHGRLQAAA